MRKAGRYYDVDNAYIPARTDIYKEIEGKNSATYDIEIFPIAYLERPWYSKSVVNHKQDKLNHLSVFRVEMSKRWDVLFFLRECE